LEHISLDCCNWLLNITCKGR